MGRQDSISYSTAWLCNSHHVTRDKGWGRTWKWRGGRNEIGQGYDYIGRAQDGALIALGMNEDMTVASLVSVDKGATWHQHNRADDKPVKSSAKIDQLLLPPFTRTSENLCKRSARQRPIEGTLRCSFLVNCMGTTANFILMFLLVSLLSPSRSYASPRVTEDLIAALANTLLTTVYHDDGAADATITAQSTQDPSRQGAPAQVRAILDLGPSCIPVLVAHLDDQRLTSAKFDWGAHAPIQVPLGYICLDILLHATSGNTVHVVDYVDDGLGARIRSGYYFRPDILRRRAGAATMRRVKARGQRAYPMLALTSVKKAKSEYAVRFQI